MSIDYSVLANPKPLPRKLTGSWKKSENARRMQDAFDAVDRRDKGISRISGKETFTNTSDRSVLRVHCHIRGRNVAPEDKYDPAKIFTATWNEHELYDHHAIEREGDNADKRLIFRWNRDMVPAGKEPFRLLSKRRSQNR